MSVGRDSMTSSGDPFVRQSIFDVASHRANDNYTFEENLKRVLWMVVQPLMRFMPRFWYNLRNGILRAFGAKIGVAVRIYPTVQIAHPWNLEVGDEVTVGDAVCLYSLGKIRIGAGTMISQRAHLCAGTHDYLQCNMPLLKKRIEIGRGCWVCTEAFIGPGCTVGAFSIVGARSVVLKSFPEMSIIGGHPAHFLKPRPLPMTKDIAKNET